MIKTSYLLNADIALAWYRQQIRKALTFFDFLINRRNSIIKKRIFYYFYLMIKLSKIDEMNKKKFNFYLYQIINLPEITIQYELHFDEILHIISRLAVDETLKGAQWSPFSAQKSF
ncbi:hypothetical protein BpHYR1_028236 [Brachionus plicatilis]|uniref:Uncharacterized protein n=1 Tax=Brachionus plicatilis TaxID=10195 RepID=A0A3M7R6H1_BRAPC|nr:hypothetical protein BpHYR1_028236 [Brachionus plicatilis]